MIKPSLCKRGHVRSLDNLSKRGECLTCRKLKQKERWKRRSVSSLLYAAKHRAKTNGIEFSITAEDLSIPVTCPLLGIPLFFGSKDARANTPSIDRIDPSKGYIVGNVWIISLKANAIKSDLTLSQMQTFVSAWAQTA